MSKKQTFELSLVWDTSSKSIDISSAPSSHFKDGVLELSSSLNWHQFLIKTIELEVELPEDFDPLQPQLKALDAKEKAVTAKYQLDMTNIKAERQKLLALENHAS